MSDDICKAIDSCCERTSFDFSLVDYPVYRNEEVTVFVPCPEGFTCTNPNGIEITIPAGEIEYRPTTSGGNGGGSGTGAGGVGSGSGSGSGSTPQETANQMAEDLANRRGILYLGPRPAVHRSSAVSGECPDETAIPTNEVNLPAGMFSSGESQEAATAAAQAAANAMMDCYWANSEQTYTAECPPELFGDPVEKTVATATFTSLISQADSDAQALASAQSMAEAELECFLYENAEQTAECPEGQEGAPVTIPAGTYFSNVSQGDADLQAIDAAEAALDCSASCEQTILDSLTWTHTGGGVITTGSGSGASGGVTCGTNANSTLTSSGITNNCGLDLTIEVSIDWFLTHRHIDFLPSTCSVGFSYNGVTVASHTFTTTACGNDFCPCEDDSDTLTGIIVIPNGSAPGGPITNAIAVNVSSLRDGGQLCGINTGNFTITVL